MGKFALITGGELRNRGAQAMTFATVCAIRNYLPELEPVVASFADARPGIVGALRGRKPRSDINNLSFSIMRPGFDYLASRSGWRAQRSFRERQRDALTHIVHIKDDLSFERVLDNCEICFDVSGYAFGAQWGYLKCQQFLDRIEVLRSKGVPTYLMPQSFGPFSFEDVQLKKVISERAQELLTWPRIIMCREEQGLHDLLELCPEASAVLAEDLVLQSDELNLSDIFLDLSLIPERNDGVREHTVAVVPNARTFEHGGEDQVLRLWSAIVSELLALGHNVAIVRHSEDDGLYCKTIKELFKGDSRVQTFLDDRYCFEYERIFRSCDYVVASRFHAVVHAYRSGRPCVVLGWATKYRELLQRMNQLGYVHDVRKLESIHVKAVIDSIRLMDSRFDFESQVIVERVRLRGDTEDVFKTVIDDFGSSTDG